MTGTIRTLLRDKGYGFIRNGAACDYFFHRNDVVPEEWPWLGEGTAVTFEPAPVEACTRGPKAQQVKRLSVVS